MNAHEQEYHDQLLDTAVVVEQEPADMLAEQLDKLRHDSATEGAYAGRMERALEHIRLICRLARGSCQVQDLLEVLDVIEDHAKVRGPSPWV